MSRRSRSRARPRSAVAWGRCVADDQAGDTRARRQIRQPRLRRRRPRGRRVRAPRGLRQRGTGLLRALRILVERSAMDRSWRRWSRGGALRVGDPFDDGTEMGPLISADHRDKVASYLDDAPVAFRGSASATGLASGSRPRSFRRSRTTTAPPARRSSARSRGHPLRRRGRGGQDRQRHGLWALGLDLDAGRCARSPRRARARDRQYLGQLEHFGACDDAVRRLQAVGLRARARPFALEHYTELKNVFISTS